eukprot:5442028-Pleurochrysis_carterae.AAC.3
MPESWSTAPAAASSPCGAVQLRSRRGSRAHASFRPSHQPRARARPQDAAQRSARPEQTETSVAHRNTAVSFSARLWYLPRSRRRSRRRRAAAAAACQGWRLTRSKGISVPSCAALLSYVLDC